MRPESSWYQVHLQSTCQRCSWNAQGEESLTAHAAAITIAMNVDGPLRLQRRTEWPQDLGIQHKSSFFHPRGTHHTDGVPASQRRRQNHVAIRLADDGWPLRMQGLMLKTTDPSTALHETWHTNARGGIRGSFAFDAFSASLLCCRAMPSSTTAKLTATVADELAARCRS